MVRDADIDSRPNWFGKRSPVLFHRKNQG